MPTIKNKLRRNWVRSLVFLVLTGIGLFLVYEITQDNVRAVKANTMRLQANSIRLMQQEARLKNIEDTLNNVAPEDVLQALNRLRKDLIESGVIQEKTESDATR